MSKPLEAVVSTIPCCHCHKKGTVTVNRIEYEDWVSGDKCIQEAIPSASAEVREQLITGTHPACFNAIFGEER